MGLGYSTQGLGHHVHLHQKGFLPEALTPILPDSKLQAFLMPGTWWGAGVCVSVGVGVFDECTVLFSDFHTAEGAPVITVAGRVQWRPTCGRPLENKHHQNQVQALEALAHPPEKGQTPGSQAQPLAFRRFISGRSCVGRGIGDKAVNYEYLLNRPLYCFRVFFKCTSLKLSSNRIFHVQTCGVRIFRNLSLLSEGSKIHPGSPKDPGALFWQEDTGPPLDYSHKQFRGPNSKP